VQVFQKDKGWIQFDDKTEDFDKEQIGYRKEELHAYHLSALLALNDKDCKLSAADEKKVYDRLAVGVRAECKGYAGVTLYFDKENHQLLLMERRSKDPRADQEFTEETYFNDYKKVNGVLTSFKRVTKRDGKLYDEMEITDLAVKDKLDDGLFKKPAK
jgi:hypothetical protein